VATLVAEIGNLLMEQHIMVGTSLCSGLRCTFLADPALLFVLSSPQL